MGARMLIWATIFIIIHSVYGGVIELSDNNINRIGSGTWLVKFYAPWCQHCKKLAPVWEEVSNHFARSDEKIKVAKIDCEAYSALCVKEGVNGYPTLKYYVDGIQKNYIGGRKKSDILNFVHKMNKPITIEMKQENIPVAFKQENPSIILVAGRNSEVKTNFTTVAKHIHEVISPEFYFLNDKSLAQEFVGDLPDQTIVSFREGDRRVYKGPFDVETLLEWVKENRFAYMSKYSEASYETLSKAEKFLVLCITDTISPEQEKFSADCKKVAKQRSNDSRYLFASLDALQYDRYATSFGAVPDILPTVVVLDESNEIHYIVPSAKFTSPEKIESFLQEIEAGNIKSETWSYHAYIIKQITKRSKLVWNWIVNNIALFALTSVALVAVLIFACCLPGNGRPKTD